MSSSDDIRQRPIAWTDGEPQTMVDFERTAPSDVIERWSATGAYMTVRYCLNGVCRFITVEPNYWAKHPCTDCGGDMASETMDERAGRLTHG